MMSTPLFQRLRDPLLEGLEAERGEAIFQAARSRWPVFEAFTDSAALVQWCQRSALGTSKRALVTAALVEAYQDGRDPFWSRTLLAAFERFLMRLSGDLYRYRMDGEEVDHIVALTFLDIADSMPVSPATVVFHLTQSTERDAIRALQEERIETGAVQEAQREACLRGLADPEDLLREVPFERRNYAAELLDRLSLTPRTRQYVERWAAVPDATFLDVVLELADGDVADRECEWERARKELDRASAWLRAQVPSPDTEIERIEARPVRRTRRDSMRGNG